MATQVQFFVNMYETYSTYFTVQRIAQSRQVTAAPETKPCQNPSFSYVSLRLNSDDDGINFFVGCYNGFTGSFFLIY